MADAGGRIYSRVPGSARGDIAEGGRRPADRSAGGRASRGAESDQERQWVGVHLCGARGLAAGSRGEADPGGRGSPWENGYIESFHSRLRDEFLERIEFESAADARAKGKWTVGSTIRSGHTAHWDMRPRGSSVRPATRKEAERAFLVDRTLILQFVEANSHFDWTRKRGAAQGLPNSRPRTSSSAPSTRSSRPWSPTVGSSCGTSGSSRSSAVPLGRRATPAPARRSSPLPGTS